MADEPNTNSAPEGRRIETAVAGADTVTVFSGDSSETKEQDAFELDLGKSDDAEASGDNAEASSEEDPEADPDESADAGDSDEAALPDYDPANEEVTAAYAKRYEKDGYLNLEALSKDYWAAYAKAGEKVDDTNFPEGVYAYLRDVAGLPKDAVKRIEKSLVNDHIQEQAAVITKVAPVPVFDAAIKWAKSGGYTEAQRARFNAEFDKGGEAQADAIEALVARHERHLAAQNGGQQQGRNGFNRFGTQNRRPSSPQRDVSGRAGAGGAGASADVFKTKAEHSEAFGKGLAELKAAKAEGNRERIRAADKALDAIRAKARRSKFR